MTGSARLRPVVVVGLILALLAVALRDVQGDDQLDVSEVQCRPYIEKALKDLGTGNVDESSREDDGKEGGDGQEVSNEQVDGDGIQDSNEKESGQGSNEQESGEEGKQESGEEGKQESGEDSKQDGDGQESGEQSNTSVDATESEENKEQADEPVSLFLNKIKLQLMINLFKGKKEDGSEESTAEVANESSEQNPDDNKDSVEQSTEKPDEEPDQESKEADKGDESKEAVESQEENAEASETDTEENVESEKDEILEQSDEVEAHAENEIDSNETKEQENTEEVKSEETGGDVEKSEEVTEEKDKTEESAEAGETVEESKEDEHVEGDLKSEEAKSSEASVEDTKSVEEVVEEVESEEAKVSENEKSDENTAEDEGEGRSEEDKRESDEKNEDDAEVSRQKRDVDADVDVDVDKESTEGNKEKSEEVTQDSKEDDKVDEETYPEEDLIQEIEIPDNLRARDHINQILRLDHDNEDKEAAIEKAADVILKELKRLYDTAIQPLETLYKYRDLSNRHFGDPEIFSKPLILFMGPWSGGKSSIINYLLDNEFKTTALRTGGSQECIEESCKPPNGTDAGAEPSPAYFNIVMHGEEEEVLDGTQLAADWTFSGLQKFGQGLLDRLRGLKLNNKLLEKVNIVEIPGILEIRKQVQRLFPFNDACQWFIDRADIIFLVYDPSKLDVGPETEAILDQLKGREYQTRIVLNKADQVKPEELMRVQGALIWNISPLMSSAEPPVMYSTSLWSMPYEAGAPTRLLYAQERAFLRDLRTAIDKRVEHKIASARRFAVRVRNHAKMVDCYLTTYYNHKSFFGGKKEISDRIIENPQEYHIYEGLSTLTNISRYDLPDPDVYRDFFRLNQLYDFPLLSSTCTYFRGCPINRLDVAIAYDLPELVGKYKKAVEAAIHEENGQPPAS